MEWKINLFQEKVDQTLMEMKKAMQEYETTHDSSWLAIFLVWKMDAQVYLSLGEQALEFISRKLK